MSKEDAAKAIANDWVDALEAEWRRQGVTPKTPADQWRAGLELALSMTLDDLRDKIVAKAGEINRLNSLAIEFDVKIQGMPT